MKMMSSLKSAMRLAALSIVLPTILTIFIILAVLESIYYTIWTIKGQPCTCGYKLKEVEVRSNVFGLYKQCPNCKATYQFERF